MEKINSSASLKIAISKLEEKQFNQGQILKEQFYLTYESLKPVNILKNTFKDLTDSNELTNNIMGTVIGLASGYLSKRIVTGASSSSFRKILGSFMQVAITNFVFRNPENIKSYIQSILHLFLGKREEKSI
jgi:hypothetical protein